MSEFKLEIITAKMPGIVHGHAKNWSVGAIITELDCFPEKLTVSKDGKAQFGIRLMPDGTLIITDYAHLGFSHHIGQNLTLNADNPWNKK